MTNHPDFDTAFASFLVAAQSTSDRTYRQFQGAAQVQSTGPKLVAEHGRRYVRIVAENGQRSAWAFVDKTTGAVLKPDGWKAPAKGARGNIFDSANGCGRACWTGVW